MDYLKFQRFYSKNLNLHFCNTDKFKTTTLLLTLTIPFSKKYATEIALLPFILKAGTERFPTPQLLEEKLNKIYANDLVVDINRKGDNHFISFEIECPTDTIINNLTNEGIDLLFEILLSPSSNNRNFNEKSLEYGQILLMNKVNLFSSNDFLYSYTKLIEEMYKDELFSVPIYGEKIGNLENIDKNTVYKVYEEVLESSKKNLYIVGDVSINKTTDYIQKYYSKRLNYRPSNLNHTSLAPMSNIKDKINIVKEERKKSQATLLFGIKTSIVDDEFSLTVLRLADAILGKFPNSKLFTEIREKHNLCYFIRSQIDTEKKHIIISAGISSNDYDKSLSLIKNEISKLRSGEFSIYNVENAKNSLINLLKESYDNPKGIIDHFIQSNDNNMQTLEEKIRMIKRISKDDIMNVTKNWRIDTIYFLR